MALHKHLHWSETIFVIFVFIRLFLLIYYFLVGLSAKLYLVCFVNMIMLQGEVSVSV